MKLHRLRWRSPKWLAAVAIVEILSAPAHGGFQPIKVMTPVPGEDFPQLPNPPEVTQPRRCWARVSHLGKTECGEVTARFVAKRLNLHTRTEEQHIKCCATCLQCKDRLIIDGGKLRHEDICVEEKHHSLWLVQGECYTRFAERGLWSPISCLWTGTSDFGLCQGCWQHLLLVACALNSQ